MNFIILLVAPVLLLAATPQRANTQDPGIAYAFVKDVADDAIGFESIIKDYLCIDNTESGNELKSNKTDLLIMQLKALRDALKEDPWEIKTYLKIPVKEQNIQIDAKEKQHIYALQSDRKIICFIWVQDSKIVSFSTIDKGGTRIFMKICR